MILKIAPPHARVRALATHLMRTDDGNEKIRIAGSRGTLAEDVLGALQEMAATKRGSRCQKPLYHVAFNAAPGEHLTTEQWDRALDIWERKMGLEDRQRIVVQHYKDDRFHTHVVWNRIDPETGLAVNIGRDFFKAKEVAREIEQEFGLQKVPDKRPEHRKEQQPPLRWEAEQCRRTKTDTHVFRDKIVEAWERSDNGQAFQNALETEGLLLAKGDRRPYLVVDEQGNFYALSGRTLPNTRMTDIRAKLKDVDQSQLPDVEHARELIEEREREKKNDKRKNGDGDEGAPALKLRGNPVDEIHDKYRRAHIGLNEKSKSIEEAHAKTAAELARVHEREREHLAEKQRDRWWHKIVRKGEKLKEKEERIRAQQEAEQARERATLERRYVKELASIEAKRAELREKEKQERALQAQFTQLAHAQQVAPNTHTPDGPTQGFGKVLSAEKEAAIQREREELEQRERERELERQRARQRGRSLGDS